MRTNCLLDSQVRRTVSDLLGVVLQPGRETSSILDSVDDHLFIWNEKNQSVLAVSLSAAGESRFQTLNFADCPQHSVTGLRVSRTGRWIALFSEEGVTAMEVPRRSGAEGRFGGGDTELLCRSISVYRKRDDRAVKKVAWHPGSQAENHLLLLTEDGSLCLHLLGDLASRVVRKISLGGGRVSSALGEVAADFCFGPAVETDAANIWPIFILCADGDVYYVDGDLSAAEWSVEGPVEMVQEEDYSEELCSVLVVGGKSGRSVLVAAGVKGTVRHYMMLGDPRSGKLSLYLYEKVELDLGPLNSTSDTNYTCPLRLYPDLSSVSRYLVLHDSGLHQVELTVPQSGELLDNQTESVVEHLVCTRPTMEAPPAPPLGATVSYPPAVIFCLLADNSLHVMKCRGSATWSTAQYPPLSEDRSVSAVEDIEERIRRIFWRDSTQPLILSAPQTSIGQAQTLELLSRATETLHQEYISKLGKAREELGAHVKLLQGKKQSQETLLGRLEAMRTDLRSNAEAISEKYEDVKDRGSDLAARVEAVLAKVQIKVPAASDAELKMARDIKLIRNKMEQIKVATEQLKEKEKYQRYQIENVSKQSKSCVLKQDQVENMKEVLQGNSVTITKLVKTITTAKKDISL